MLTHHAREPLETDGGRTFHFVTDGIESALEQARAAAADRDVLVGGGANPIRQYLAAGPVDEFHLAMCDCRAGWHQNPFDGPSRDRTSRTSGTGAALTADAHPAP